MNEFSSGAYDSQATHRLTSPSHKRARTQFLRFKKKKKKTAQYFVLPLHSSSIVHFESENRANAMSEKRENDITHFTDCILRCIFRLSRRVLFSYFEIFFRNFLFAQIWCSFFSDDFCETVKKTLFLTGRNRRPTLNLDHSRLLLIQIFFFLMRRNISRNVLAFKMTCFDFHFVRWFSFIDEGEQDENRMNFIMHSPNAHQSTARLCPFDCIISGAENVNIEIERRNRLFSFSSSFIITFLSDWLTQVFWCTAQCPCSVFQSFCETEICDF